MSVIFCIFVFTILSILYINNVSPVFLVIFLVRYYCRKDYMKLAKDP